MPEYTVIAAWIDDELVIAGVTEGDVKMVDQDPYISGLSRFAESVEAESAQEAERLILEEHG